MLVASLLILGCLIALASGRVPPVLAFYLDSSADEDFSSLLKKGANRLREQFEKRAGGCITHTFGPNHNASNEVHPEESTDKQQPSASPGEVGIVPSSGRYSPGPGDAASPAEARPSDEAKEAETDVLPFAAAPAAEEDERSHKKVSEL